jgi:NADH-quinone oxidoreductase subunit C
MNTSIEQVALALGSKVLLKTIYQSEVTITVDKTVLFEVLKALKEQHGFTYFVDCFATDHYTDQDRFEVNYNLYNIEGRTRIRVKTFVQEDDPTVDSVVSLWPAADWNERETWDMHGIKFIGHPDLRRMFMPEDFEFFPLRKEFPLIGIPGSIQLPENDGPKSYK